MFYLFEFDKRKKEKTKRKITFFVKINVVGFLLYLVVLRYVTFGLRLIYIGLGYIGLG